MSQVAVVVEESDMENDEMFISYMGFKEKRDMENDEMLRPRMGFKEKRDMENDEMLRPRMGFKKKREVAVDVEENSKMSDRETEKRREAVSLMRWSVRIRRVVIVLAALEQAATYLAQIAFLGATVVLLGGYATRLKLYDFVLISALLLSEGVRVFLANQNAEYTRGIGMSAGNWAPGICVGPWLIALGDYRMDKRDLIISIFQVLQMASAAVTFAFSLSRLKSGNYKPTLMSSPSDAGEVANFVYGIRLFYILTLVESSVFLVVKAVGWELLAPLLSVVVRREIRTVLLVFALTIYGVFLSEGFGKASATNFFNFILENPDDACVFEEPLKVLRWQIPDKAETRESIKCLIRLTAPGQPEEIRRCASQILAKATARDGGIQNFALAVPEFGRIPLEVVDIDVIKFLDDLVRDAPLGFLPFEAVSKQASKFLIRSMFEGDDADKAQAALTFLNWWGIPSVYRNYGFDPADIFYRLYIDRRQRVVDSFNLEAALEYEAIAEPIRTAFSREVTTSDVMTNLLRRVDFSKLKNKHSTINLSGIVAEVIGESDDYVVDLVAAWIWFMDESTFEKAISNLTKEELGMLKTNATIYSAILTSKNELAFSI